MGTLVILAHPKRDGFNRAVAQAAAGDGGRIVDLYGEGFDPVMPEAELPRKFSFDEAVLRYQDAIKSAEHLVFVHPDWWGGPPAILKGFLDRVLRPGVAYGFREADFRDAGAKGLLEGKRATVLISTDSPEPSGGADAWPPARIWKESVLGFCGIDEVDVRVFWKLRESGYAERKAWIDAAATDAVRSR